MIVVLQHIANWPIFVYGLLAITVCSQIVAGSLTTLEPGPEDRGGRGPQHRHPARRPGLLGLDRGAYLGRLLVSS